MDTLVFKGGGWLLAALLALMAAVVAADFGFAVHMGIVDTIQEGTRMTRVRMVPESRTGR